MTPIAVRPCQAVDVPALTAIYRHAVVHGTGTFELDPPDEAEMGARFARITGGGYPYVVACDEATPVGFTPVSTTAVADDHKAYYPGAQPISIRITGDAESGKLLGAQLVGARGTETAKRVDTFATALFHGMTVPGVSDLDLSYTPPLGSPWDAVQIATQRWEREHAKIQVNA